MKNVRYFLLSFVIWCSAISLSAQVLTITKEFELVPNSSVLAMYKNHFGKWEKPDMDDTFPYAVVRVALEGDEREVNAAKKKLAIYLGTQRMIVDVYTDRVNEILFLLPSAAGRVMLQCGDGCETQTIIDLPRLRSNMVYSGIVHYVPAENADPLEAVDKEQLKTELLTEIAQMLKEQNESSQAEEKTASVTKSDVPVKVGGQSVAVLPRVEKPQTVDSKQVTTDNKSNYEEHKKKIKTKTLVMVEVGAFAKDSVTYGFKVAQLYNGIGWHVSGRSNFLFNAPTSTSSNASMNGYINHWVVNAGFMANFLEKRSAKKQRALGCYLGAGYGVRQVFAKGETGEWIEDALASQKGFSGNVGLFGNLYGATIGIGVNTINFKYLDIEIGIGFMF